MLSSEKVHTRFQIVFEALSGDSDNHVFSVTTLFFLKIKIVVTNAG